MNFLLVIFKICLNFLSLVYYLSKFYIDFPIHNGHSLLKRPPNFLNYRTNLLCRIGIDICKVGSHKLIRTGIHLRDFFCIRRPFILSAVIQTNKIIIINKNVLVIFYMHDVTCTVKLGRLLYMAGGGDPVFFFRD